MKELKVSVVIPVRNGEATLERCLESLRKQTIGNSLQIIIPDSMSTDESRVIALKYGAEVIDIAEGTFNHGLTRNIGVEHATSELIYLTVQDAWIAQEDMLERMAEHFNDLAVMGVTGHQAVPHERDKNPILWYKPYSMPEVKERRVTDIDKFKKLSSHEQSSLIAWDDVVSMYRKNALTELSFIETEFAEDWVWSYSALMKGWKLLYDPSLVAYHYHHQSFRYAFNLAYTYNYHFYKYFGYKPKLPRTIKPVAEASYHLLKNNNLSLKEKVSWIIHNMGYRLANYFSTIDFLLRMRGGQKSIEKGYIKYCKAIPQGKQKLI